MSHLILNLFFSSFLSWSGTTYFETRPRSRSHKSDGRQRLGGTKFNRSGHEIKSLLTMNAKQNDGPNDTDEASSVYSDYIPGYNKFKKERRTERLLYEQNKLNNTNAKKINDKKQRIADGLVDVVYEEQTLATESVPDTPETTLPPVPNQMFPSVKVKPSSKRSPRMLSPRQHEKLKKMLKKSVGNRYSNTLNNTNGSGYPLRPVVTMLDIQSGKVAAGERGITPKNMSTKVPIGSPRSWTQVLRGGNQRNVWKDTRDDDQTFQTRFQGKNSPRDVRVPKPPLSSRGSGRSYGRGSGRSGRSGRSDRYMDLSPRYYKHRE